MVGASVPVVWPILESAEVQIFVTREVKVTSESRLGTYPNGHDSVELQESVLLLASAAGPGGTMSKGQSCAVRRSVSLSRLACT